MPVLSWGRRSMTAFNKAWDVAGRQPSAKEDEDSQEILEALDGASNLIWNLHDRWQDEGPQLPDAEPYEDFSQYREVIQKNWPYEIFDARPDPFSFDFKDQSGGMWRIKIENNQMMLMDLIAQ